jgi:hypothetical protein
MKKSKKRMFTLLSTVAIAAMSCCVIATSCHPNPKPNPDNSDIAQCNYTVKAQTENANSVGAPKFYIGPGIKGYVSGE